MKKILLIIILFCGISVSYAQERFFNLYPGWITKYVEETEDCYLLFSEDTLYQNSITPIFSKIDLLGNFIESFRYVSDTIYGFSIYTADSYSIHNNYFIASGVYLEFVKNYILNPILMYFNNGN